jgi:excisionase family DNA binding protein
MTAVTEQLIDIAGLAERLGVSERFVRRLVDERRIPFLKIGRHVRFQPDDVERWIRASRVDPSQPFGGRVLAGSRP